MDAVSALREWRRRGVRDSSPGPSRLFGPLLDDRLFPREHTHRKRLSTVRFMHRPCLFLCLCFLVISSGSHLGHLEMCHNLRGPGGSAITEQHAAQGTVGQRRRVLPRMSVVFLVSLLPPHCVIVKSSPGRALSFPDCLLACICHCRLAEEPSSSCFSSRPFGVFCVAVTQAASSRGMLLLTPQRAVAQAQQHV